MESGNSKKKDKMQASAKYIMEYDFYGAFLTKRQQEVVELYHEENYTLAEIGDEFGISRQGVHDALKNAEAQLDSYEAKLGLVSRFEKTRNGIDKIDKLIDELVIENKDNEELTKKLKKVKSITDELSE